MGILGIDTSITTGSVALVEDERVVAEYTLDIQATHSQRLLPAISRVLRDTGEGGPGLSGIAVAIGPGSFTGLRIGVATAKALAYIWQKPLIGVTVLESLAYQVGFSAPWVCSLVDARHNEVYGCLYKTGDLPTQAAPPKADSVGRYVEEVLGLVDGQVCFVGDGARAYGGVIGNLARGRLVTPPGNSMYLRASSVALLGRAYLEEGKVHDPMTLAPVYMRLPEAERRRKARGLPTAPTEGRQIR